LLRRKAEGFQQLKNWRLCPRAPLHSCSTCDILGAVV
jgi:hypothetical protein